MCSQCAGDYEDPDMTREAEDRMTFEEYHQLIADTANYPGVGFNLVYPALGLAGEAGEASEKVKKLWRDHGVTSRLELEREGLDNAAIIKELGDVLWYVDALATELGVTLEHVARVNTEKLISRLNRGTLAGQGDER
jgi:NTP pyrophosphatase (non-canonical NTP hydrolase)